MLSFSAFRQHQEKIAIIGLGYVGLPLAVHLTDHFAVVGFDISAGRVAELRAGHDRTREVDNAQLQKPTHQYTSNPQDMADCRLFIVAVPTPIDEYRCSQNSDYIFPATACMVQNELGLKTSCGALDFNLGCSGYIYGLGMAKGLVDSGLAKKILFITVEVLTKFIGKADKSNRTIIGDGATANLVTSEKKGFELMNFVFGTDGSGIEHIIIKEGGSRCPEISNVVIEDEYGNKHKDSELYMNGREVFTFVLSTVPQLIADTLAKNNLAQDDISHFIFHQANKYMLDNVRKKIGIPEEKYVILMGDCGNTSSCSVPVSFTRLMVQKEIHSGEYLCLAGFGVGLSWGGVVIRKV